MSCFARHRNREENGNNTDNQTYRPLLKEAYTKARMHMLIIHNLSAEDIAAVKETLENRGWKVKASL